MWVKTLPLTIPAGAVVLGRLLRPLPVAWPTWYQTLALEAASAVGFLLALVWLLPKLPSPRHFSIPVQVKYPFFGIGLFGLAVWAWFCFCQIVIESPPGVPAWLTVMVKHYLIPFNETTGKQAAVGLGLFMLGLAALRGWRRSIWACSVLAATYLALCVFFAPLVITVHIITVLNFGYKEFFPLSNLSGLVASAYLAVRLR